MKIDKQTILERLDYRAFYKTFIPSLQETGKPQALVNCTFHDDKNPSLSINLEDGCYNCFSCGAKGDVFNFYQELKKVDFPTAIKELAEMEGITETAVKQKVVATYEYKDVEGKPLYLKERIEPGRNGRSKEFLFKHIEAGKKVVGRGGDPVLYNLPEVVKATSVIVVEGEGKVELLRKWGLAATCTDSGSKSPWKEGYFKTLENKVSITILPDNDQPGRDYALSIANNLYGKTLGSLSIVELPGLGERREKDGLDIIDWSRIEGNGKERLLELLKQAPAWKPIKINDSPKLQAISITDFLRYEFPPKESILDPWLPSQGLSMIYAPRGIGKTFLALSITVAVVSGSKVLRWSAPKPRGVLYLDGEMPGNTMQKRLSHIIASMENEPAAPLQIITPDIQPLEIGMPNLTTIEGQEAIEPYLSGISLVIVDNISTLCRGGRENDSESWLPVQEWALKLRSRGLSVLFIHHAGKGGMQRGTSSREDILDTVISLRRPGDYTPNEGAHFEIHFEKSRGFHGNDAKPFDVKLVTNPNGMQEWVMKDLEESLTEKVASLLNDGVPQHEISKELNVTPGTVSKHKKKAIEQGLLKAAG